MNNMAKHLCCSAFGKIYYANVNDKGIITGQKIDLTEDKAEIEINGFKLIFDGTGNLRFMEKHGGKNNG